MTYCPHCGKSLRANHFARHVAVCLSDPAVRERVLLALRDSDDPTRAVSSKNYSARRTACGAVSIDVLTDNCGSTWARVCAEFGLLEPLPYAQKCKITPPSICPHCGESVDYHNSAKHNNTCVRNPAVREAVLFALRDPQNDSHAISAERYNARRVLFGAPSDRTLVMQYDGTWESVYADFGLQRPLIYSRKMDKVVCEHCSGEFGVNLFERHAAVCPKNPVYFDAIYAALQDDDDPDYAVPLETYRERARLAGVAGADTLKETFGGWRVAVEYFGLIPADAAELQQRRAMMAVLAMAAKEERLLREDRESAGAFQALRVRDLPGVTVNGRACVAVMLR